MEYNRQRTSEITDNLVLRWTPRGSASQEIQGRLSYLMSPLKVSFLVTSPWKTFEKVEGHFSLFESELNREMKLYVNGPAPALPLNFEVKLGGTTAEFGHSISASWHNGDSKTQKSLQFTAAGRLASLDDGELKVSAKIPNHRFQCDMSTRRTAAAGLQVETKVAYDEERVELGLGWLVEGLDKIQTSLWILYPDRPKMIASFEHFRLPDSYFLDISCGLVGSSMGNLRVDLKEDGWLKWDMTTSVSSPGNLIPDIEFSSKHDLTNWRELRHTTDLNVKEISEFWGGHADQIGSFTFNILDGEKIESRFSFNTKYVEITGEVNEARRSVRIKALTPLFPQYDVTVGAQLEPLGGGLLTVELNHNSERLYYYEIWIVANDSSMGGKLHLDCPWGHVLEGEGNLDWVKGLLELDLRETKQELLNLKLRAEVSPGRNNSLIPTKFQDIPHFC